MAKKEKVKKFVQSELSEQDIEQCPKHDFNELYNRAHAELSLQQSKRDQIIAVYIAITSFLIPFALSSEALDMTAKGLIFFAVALIGIMFTIITIRYRIYKEIYWLCCETITRLININQARLNKSIVQTMFYRSLLKKGGKYIAKNGKWMSGKYFSNNIFSSETLHYIILAFMSTILLGLSAYLCFPIVALYRILLSVAVGVVAFVIILALYFTQCQKVYAVLVDGTDNSFNYAFSKAWFLHIYLDEKDYPIRDAGEH